MKISNIDNVISVAGRLDQSGAAKLKEFIENDEIKEFELLELEFSGVEFLNSAGIGGIIEIYKELNAKKKKLRLIKLKPHIYSVFEIAGLVKILDIS